MTEEAAAPIISIPGLPPLTWLATPITSNITDGEDAGIPIRIRIKQ